MDFSLHEQRDIIDISHPIIVGMESFSDLKDAAPISDDGKIWDIKLMEFDKESRNVNVYPADDTRRSVAESTFIQEQLRSRTLFGELEHPPADAPLSRFLFIEPTRYAWCITSIIDRGDCFIGRVVLCSPLGTSIMLPNVKELGSNYASSCRIYTPNYVEKQENGRKVYIKKYRMYPITWDAVCCPGYSSCRVANTAAYNPRAVGKEALYAVEFNNPEKELIEMIKSSENSKILEDYFKVDFRKDAVLMKDGKVQLSTEDGIKVIASLDRYILSGALKSE
jgi:hypothetical protein